MICLWTVFCKLWTIVCNQSSAETVGLFYDTQCFHLEVFENFKFLKYYVHAVHAADKLFGAAACAEN